MDVICKGCETTYGGTKEQAHEGGWHEIDGEMYCHGCALKKAEEASK